MNSRRVVTRGTWAMAVILLWCSSVGAQIYFSDDFDDPAQSIDKWEVITGDWQVADGVYHQLATDGPWQAAMVAAERWKNEWQEYTIEFDVKPLTEGDAPVNVLFRVQDPVPEVWDDRNGPDTHMYRWIINGWTNTESRPYIYNEGTATMLAQTENSLDVGTWYHIKLVVTMTGLAGYVNDVELFNVQHAQWTEGRVGLHAYSGMMDFDNLVIYGPLGRVAASNPIPEHEASDVPTDAVLSWTAGALAQTHDVYLGTAFGDVNDAGRSDARGVLVSQGQAAGSYTPDTLELGQTYYWRIDEVNGAPDNTIFKGEVWSFTVEPFAYPIANVTATASSAEEGSGPENTINGSGLDDDDLHSVGPTDMWLSRMDGPQPTTIEYTFDRAYKLHQMLVWNYNVEFETFLGYGLKDVTIEYSDNGVDWAALGDFEFAQAASQTDYAANTTIDFGGLLVRAVRLTVNSGWGQMFPQYGLSEVRFLHVPTRARNPEPADGQVDVDIATSLTWRAGREAATHEVYLGTDEQAVLDGAAWVGSTATGSFTPDDLALGMMYYWKVDAVNEAEAVSVWDGYLWSFQTAEYAIIEDFEAYNDDDNLIYEAWIDGWSNGSGSIVGYFEAPFAEQGVVNSGHQSMPLQYDNSGAPFYSEADFDLGGMDLTGHGADTLRLYIHGQAGNSPETLYVTLEDASGQMAVVTSADTALVTTEAWQAWAIPYGDFTGIDLGNVRTITIGVGNPENPTASGAGTLFIDDLGFGHPIGE